MDLFASATRDGGVRVSGDIAIVDFGGDHGVLVVPVSEYRRVRRIAEEVPASQIRPKDVRQFADLFNVRIARPGAAFPTRGKAGALLPLARGMRQAGLEYNGWHLPKVVKQVLRRQGQAAAARSYA